MSLVPYIHSFYILAPLTISLFEPSNPKGSTVAFVAATRSQFFQNLPFVVFVFGFYFSSFIASTCGYEKLNKLMKRWFGWPTCLKIIVVCAWFNSEGKTGWINTTI